MKLCLDYTRSDVGGGCLFDCTRHRNSQASACDAKTNKGVACSLNKALGQLCEWVSMDSPFLSLLTWKSLPWVPIHIAVEYCS